MSLASKLEALMFVSAKPLAIRQLAGLVEAKDAEISAALLELQKKWNSKESGVWLILEGKEAQMMSAPDHAELAKKLIKDELTGELTRPSLETLTIIAYRGPVTKPEIEQIRGVNCSLILRNLEMRGLVQEEEDKTKMQPVYSVTMDFVRYLGLRSLAELPDYEKLRGSVVIRDVVAAVAK